MEKQIKDIWNKLKNQYTDDTEILDVLCDGENAAEKQTPKKPKNIRNIAFTGSINPTFSEGECPTCGEYADTDDDLKFCSECGQKLEW